MNTYYVTSGVVSSGIVLNASDYMYVYSSGTANSTTVNSCGSMYVSSGGTATNIVENGGYVDVAEGANVTFTPNTFSGLVLSSASATVHSGTTANSTTVNSRGSMYVSSGGTATNIVENGGYVEVGDGADVTFTPHTFSGLTISEAATVHSGTTANNTTLNGYYWWDQGYLYVSSGGTANTTTVNGGSMVVSSGGTANSTDVNYRGHLIVSSGGTANSTTVNSSGYLCVFSGGTANSTTVNSGGWLYVYSSGTANSTTVNSSGYLRVSSGGTAKSNFVNSGGSMLVSSGGSANDATLDGGYLYVYDGGAADNTTVFSGGYLYVSSGGTARSTTVCSRGGAVSVFSGGTANSTTVSAGQLHVFSGGTANETALGDRATSGFGGMWVFGVVNSTTFNGDGEIHVSSGGVANSTIVAMGGYLGLESEDSVANSTIIRDYGRVYGRGVANATTVDRNGDMYIWSGGTANSTVVNADGLFRFTAGGVANSTMVNSGGRMIVLSGGTATGVMTFAKGAIVSAYEGGVINFDVSEVSPEAPVRVNNLNLIVGLPDFTITVAETQSVGTYKLADGATGFDKTVTICNTAGVCDSLTVGSTVTLAGRDYTLNLTGSLLSLTVSGPAPVVTGVSDDLNGDGRADIVMTITQSGHGAEGATGAWLIQENQTAAWGDLSQRNKGWEIFGMGTTSANKTTNDVYVRSPGNVIGAWTTNESGLVNGWETVGEFSADTQVLGLGDFNGNGQTDLLLRNTNGAVGCYFIGGEKTGWNYFQSLGDEWKISAVGDLNGDGRADLVLRNDAGYAGSWLTQNDYTMEWADLDTLPDGFAIIGAGDFNGDGTDDVLLKNGDYYGAWLVNNGNAAGWMGLGNLGDVTVEQIADFDGDGKDDLRLRTAAGDLGAQLVKGADNLEWKYYGSVGAEWSTSLAAL